MTDGHRKRPAFSRNAAIVTACVACVVFMVGLAYASVPLYRLFCQVTGYGGTTQVSEQAPDAAIDRVIKVRFDANIAPNLSWSFAPQQRELVLKVGETALAFYRADSREATTTTGSATFNVTPQEAGRYFNKIECFCFTEQTLEAGETVEMPVSFFVDPAIDEDEDLDYVTTITLSYTFFAVAGENAREREAAAASDGADQGIN
jgi:cytochrome c oxidase assembly protein subunit 11